jgi:serine/threonine protein kinase
MRALPERIGKYEIECKIGSGGFATVYKARDPLLGRDVAIKVLHTNLSEDPDVVRRFYLEAKSAAALRHPHIVIIHEISESVNEQAYLVMEYLPGLSLADMLEQQRTLPADQALTILEQIAGALGCAHSHGLVHRDVKPQNIIVEQRANRELYSVLTDFGLAKVLESSELLSSGPLGTAEYMAPEQIAVGMRHKIGPATDVYALGIVAYKMLTGHVPFEGDYSAVLFSQVQERPADPSVICGGISPEVAAVLLKSLAKEPADRYASAAEMVAALHLAMSSTESHAMAFPDGSLGIVSEDYPDFTALVQTLCIPDGPFWMGSDESDPEAADNEKPRHLKYVPCYAIGKYPVTNAQYQAFVKATGHTTPTHWHGDQIPPGEETHPIVNVSYDDAQEFCRWLSRVTYLQYHLPNEYEWEKAARGPDPETRRYPWGDTWIKGWCNSAEENREGTTAVDQYETHNISPYGIVDLVGNIWEWTSSPYRPYPGSNHYSASYGTAYVVRGGAWRNGRADARISVRGRYGPDIRRPYLGFRLVLEMDG